MWVVCDECSLGWEAPEAVATARLKSGEIHAEEIVHFDHTQVVHRGKCETCRGEEAVEEVVEALPYTRGTVQQEGSDIMCRLRTYEQEHPDWTREQCSRQAVEDHNDPYKEPNMAFRAYLLDS
jgi:hypothetical protein